MSLTQYNWFGESIWTTILSTLTCFQSPWQHVKMNCCGFFVSLPHLPDWWRHWLAGVETKYICYDHGLLFQWVAGGYGAAASSRYRLVGTVQSTGSGDTWPYSCLFPSSFFFFSLSFSSFLPPCLLLPLPPSLPPSLPFSPSSHFFLHLSEIQDDDDETVSMIKELLDTRIR